MCVALGVAGVRLPPVLSKKVHISEDLINDSFWVCKGSVVSGKLDSQQVDEHRCSKQNGFCTCALHVDLPYGVGLRL